MLTGAVVVRVLGLILVVSLVCGVGLVLESKAEMGPGELAVQSLVMGIIETLSMLVGG